jgi:hypothetical protein
VGPTLGPTRDRPLFGTDPFSPFPPLLGVGRLIRTKPDRGIVVVLDNRILTKRYGQLFLNSVPKCPVEIV